MPVIIPKKLVQKDDLVIIPRKMAKNGLVILPRSDYEDFLRLKIKLGRKLTPSQKFFLKLPKNLTRVKYFHSQ